MSNEVMKAQYQKARASRNAHRLAEAMANEDACAFNRMMAEELSRLNAPEGHTLDLWGDGALKPVADCKPPE